MSLSAISFHRTDCVTISFSIRRMRTIDWPPMSLPSAVPARLRNIRGPEQASERRARTSGTQILLATCSRGRKANLHQSAATAALVCVCVKLSITHFAKSCIIFTLVNNHKTCFVSRPAGRPVGLAALLTSVWLAIVLRKMHASRSYRLTERNKLAQVGICNRIMMPDVS